MTYSQLLQERNRCAVDAAIKVLQDYLPSDDAGLDELLYTSVMVALKKARADLSLVDLEDEEEDDGEG
jgi:hypothetical protein